MRSDVDACRLTALGEYLTEFDIAIVLIGHIFYEMG